MDRLEINVHPTFILFGFVLVYIGKAILFINYLSALIIHEFTHYYVARRRGYYYSKILFMPYGLQLCAINGKVNYKDEIAIALAGPISNLCVCILIVALWWCCPVSYNYTYIFAMCNLSLGIINMLPIVPLDGGRLLLSLLSIRNNRRHYIRVFNIISFLAATLFLLLFFISLAHQVNITYLTISFFLFSALLTNDATEYLDKAKVSKQGRVLPMRHYVITKDVSLYKLLKYIRPDSYSVFYIYDGSKLVSKLTEEQIISKLDRTI